MPVVLAAGAVHPNLSPQIALELKLARGANARLFEKIYSISVKLYVSDRFL